ncbi:MAG: glycosyltransferase [Bacteroidetes bacterium]|jgi:glycosyltransferase involved in cell wall biosynthesis|nr:glycosyltransferase [Bacteroidota bacterium]
MNIILFNTEKNWGGGEKWYADVYQMLEQNGHNTNVFTHTNSKLAEQLQKKRAPVCKVKIGNLSFLNPIIIHKLKQQFKLLRADAIILNLSSDLKTAGRAARKAGIKKIIYRRGSAKPIKNSLFNRWLFKHIVTHIIANSQQTKKTILAENPHLFPKDKIKVIYNGIDEKQILPYASKRQGSSIILGNAGRLSPEKGHERLLKVARELKNMGFPFQLLIAGTGPLEKDLKVLRNRYGLKNHVRFEGFTHNFTGFLSSIDIFVLTSLYEGFGYVIIEAMAAGIPVIAFDIGTTTEIIEHDKTGYIVENNNIQQMSNLLKHLIENPRKRYEMGEAAKIKVREKFSLNEMYNQLLTVLNIV